MDGNGRWAKKQGFLERTKGHEQGAKVVRTITTCAAKIGIRSLTLYAFSTENWKRPKTEVDYLMKMLEKYLENELKTLQENNIKFSVIGDTTRFSISLQNKIAKTIQETQSNNGLNQILALNYGAKDEIARAINKLIQNNQTIDENSISNALDLPIELDLIIRTGGEKRLSNFLLWQAAYSELFFTDTLWPEFEENEFISIIKSVETRERRFGGL